ncbi:acyl-CoA thioesterase [Sphingomonas abaci]|uniref:Acyl-CoA thioester hydrolase n=1 Tax=Sphingomonas abaci TaxID=237611 RepID=A0A7W7AGY3_9SPHN|nr:acyl-CoA thioesterase [Sphingomonas abaci]MBB4616838.1 acyl-CoA thioester hydrolase [Sphingomonas abaci]
MARPAPWRLDADRFAHRTLFQTRYQDLDPNGHINNVAYAALFESARVRFNAAIALDRWRDLRFLVAKVELNYLAEGHFPADVEIATAVGPIGGRSWHLLSTMFQDGVALATCDTVLVASKAADGLPPAMRAALAAAQSPAGDQSRASVSGSGLPS